MAIGLCDEVVEAIDALWVDAAVAIGVGLVVIEDAIDIEEEEFHWCRGFVMVFLGSKLSWSRWNVLRFFDYHSWRILGFISRVEMCLLFSKEV